MLAAPRFEIPNYEGNLNTVKVVAVRWFTIRYETVKLAATGHLNLVSGTPCLLHIRPLPKERERPETSLLSIVQASGRSKHPCHIIIFLIGSLSSVITDTDGEPPARLSLPNLMAQRQLTVASLATGDSKKWRRTNLCFDLDAGEIGGTLNFVRLTDIKDAAGIGTKRNIWLRDAFGDARTEIARCSSFRIYRCTEQNGAAPLAI